MNSPERPPRLFPHIVIDGSLKNISGMLSSYTIWSEQGVTLALCLVSWIDSLLHFENYKQSTVGKLSKEPLTVSSIVRQAQYDNLETFANRVQKDEGLLKKWLEVEKKQLNRKRKKATVLINIEDCAEDCTKNHLDKAA